MADDAEGKTAAVDSMLKDGTIKKSTKPKDAFIKHPKFQKNFTPDQLRTGLNARKKYFLHLFVREMYLVGEKADSSAFPKNQVINCCF